MRTAFPPRIPAPAGSFPQRALRSEIDAQADGRTPSKPEAQASDLDWKVDAQMGATANDAPLTSTAAMPCRQRPRLWRAAIVVLAPGQPSRISIGRRLRTGRSTIG